MTTSTTATPYTGHRFPQEIIRYAVWLYFRLLLSYRDVEELLAEDRRERARRFQVWNEGTSLQLAASTNGRPPCACLA